MAKARVCDRCGVTVTDYFYDFTIYKADIQQNNNCISIQDYELCTDCINELKTFIENSHKNDSFG